MLLIAVAGCSDDGADTAGATPTTEAAATSTAAEPMTTDGATSSTDSSAAVPSAEDLEAHLQLAMEELVAMPGGPPGVVGVVQLGDDKSTFAAGVADVEGDAAPTADDHMRVASVAKAFSGATALSLVDEGVLSLDDTIGERLPDLPEAWADVTLRQLLNHTSGLPDFIKTQGFVEAVTASIDVAPPPEELLLVAEDEPLNFEPGTEYRYSNSDNIAVGLMIQEATGQSYAEVLQEQVLDPLGLDETSLPEGVEIPEPFIHGYAFTPEDPLEDVSDGLAAGWAWASGGVISTPNDLNDFIRGYVSGELYSDETRAEQQDLFIPGGESGPPGPALNSASLALFRYDTPCGTVYGHTGNTVGFTQFAVSTPDGQRSATVTMNLQRTETEEGQRLEVFEALQRVEQAAICLLLESR
ncbi:MAG: serine hydrolase domain-containing protein [Ilumatobacteraceae bacterium]